MSEAIVSQLPAGAGRFFDCVWPEQGHTVSNFTADVTARIGLDARPGSSIGVGGGSTISPNVINGIGCADFLFKAVGAGYNAIILEGSGLFHVRTQRSALGIAAVNDMAAKRYYITMATDGSPIDPNSDYGFEICPRDSIFQPFVVTPGRTGFGVLLSDTTFCRLAARGPNGYVFTDFPIDTTQFHTYEFRIVDATEDADATLQFLIDNVPQVLPAAFSSWGPGTNLPPELPLESNGAANYGFVPLIVPAASSAVNRHLYVAQVRMIMAPTLLMTL